MPILFAIIIERSKEKSNMRMCWNRQTGTFEGRVSTDVWVQVPLSAPNKRNQHLSWFLLFFVSQGDLNPRGSDVKKNGMGYRFLVRAVQPGTEGVVLGSASH